MSQLTIETSQTILRLISKAMRDIDRERSRLANSMRQITPLRPGQLNCKTASPSSLPCSDHMRVSPVASTPPTRTSEAELRYRASQVIRHFLRFPPALWPSFSGLSCRDYSIVVSPAPSFSADVAESDPIDPGPSASRSACLMYGDFYSALIIHP